MKWKLIPLLLVITGCQNIFTTNYLTALKQDPSDLTGDALIEAAKSSRDEEAIEALEKNRITADEVQDNPELKEQFIEETTLLAELKMEQADVQGALEALITSSEDGDTEDVFEDLINDTDRVEDLKSASNYVLEAYEVDPDSVSDTQKLVGSVGLMSDILSDDSKKEQLESLPDREPETLAEANFTEEEIEKIVKADEMLDGVELPEGLSGSAEGFVF